MFEQYPAYVQLSYIFNKDEFVKSNNIPKIEGLVQNGKFNEESVENNDTKLT